MARWTSGQIDRCEDTDVTKGAADSFDAEVRRAERTLARRDTVLRALIQRYGACPLRPEADHFDALVKSILSQQLSTRAAETIYRRLLALDAAQIAPSPRTILATPTEVLRSVGISGQKIGYLRDLSRAVEEGTLRLDHFPRLTDEEIIRQLVVIKGIGLWTAQMLLIFSLGRLDILPVGDLGIRKAIQRWFREDAAPLPLPGPAEIESIALQRRWAPYRSVASWYLWRSLENTP